MNDKACAMLHRMFWVKKQSRYLEYFYCPKCDRIPSDKVRFIREPPWGKS